MAIWFEHSPCCGDPTPLSESTPPSALSVAWRLALPVLDAGLPAARSATAPSPAQCERHGESKNLLTPDSSSCE